MLEQETWLDGDECVEQGFADKVIEPVKAMASLTSKRIEEFSSMPSAIKNQITPKTLLNLRNSLNQILHQSHSLVPPMRMSKHA